MAFPVVLRYLDGSDKVSLLSQVLDLAGLGAALEKSCEKTDKDPEDFKIVIKPNASMFVRRDDNGVTTDPVLVLALVTWLHEKGYPNIAVAESANAYELTYSNRDPIIVMTAMGLNGGVHDPARQFETYSDNPPGLQSEVTAHVVSKDGNLLPYQLVDLGAKTTTIPTDTMPGGQIKLASEWLNADFRISFAKFKTHVYGGYTLLVKNTYGCLPEGDKMWHYHRVTGCARPAIAQLAICPVHFNIIDGVTAADGWMGVKWDRAVPRSPGFILAGEHMGETEKTGCDIMGVAMDKSPMTKGALEFLPGTARLDGEIRPLKNWYNVPDWIISGFPMTEKHYQYYRFQQTITDGVGVFPFKRKPLGLALTYILIIPLLIYGWHRRHWLVRKVKDLILNWKIKKNRMAPKRVRSCLDRLDLPELELLLDCLESKEKNIPKIYGHKVRANGKWYDLPHSFFSKLVRIPQIIQALDTPEDFAHCAREVAARIQVLNQ